MILTSVVFASFVAIAPQSPTDAAWEKKVKDAASIADEAKKGEAMLALVRDALKSPDVQASGNTHPEAVHPDDNKAAPAINFDVRLNEKNGYRTGKPVTTSVHYFVAGGEGFIVLGPRALDPRSPIFTRMLAVHESFHAKHHIGDPRPIGDRELETWTHVFVTFFHEVHPFKQKWSPLVSNYETSDPGEQKAALDKLVAYYRQPPGDAAAVRAAFDEWLGRRKKDAETSGSALVAALEAALKTR